MPLRAHMSQKNKLIQAPPFAVEQALLRLGRDLKTARLRRSMTIKQVAEKIGSGTRAISDAEKGKLTTGVAIFAALLWAYDLLSQLNEVADPGKDEEGQNLILSKEGERARHGNEDLDNDF